MSDTIEKAAENLNRAGPDSLIERAADRMAGDGVLAPANSRPISDPISPGDGGKGVPDVGDRERRVAATNGSPKFVELNFRRLNSMGLITPVDAHTRISEEFRVIKRPLLRKAFGNGDDAIRHGNLISVTSAAPGEGKTFVALNLAMSIASERDNHVLLIDADLTRPGVLDAVGIEADMGLADVLEDRSLDLADVLVRTNVGNLTILPSGRQHSHSTELLTSNRMCQLAGEIAERYPDRIVIFDSSPLLANSQATAIAAHVGQIVLVVEAEKTTAATIRASLELLLPCENVSLVLNKAIGARRTDEFGSHYDTYRKKK